MFRQKAFGYHLNRLIVLKTLELFWVTVLCEIVNYSLNQLLFRFVYLLYYCRARCMAAGHGGDCIFVPLVVESLGLGQLMVQLF